MKFENRENLADKISWEGGIWEMLTGYGMYVDDMPDDETRAALAAILPRLEELEPLVENFVDLLPEGGW